MSEDFECEKCLAQVVEWHEQTQEVAKLLKRLLKSKRRIRLLKQRNKRLKNTLRHVRKLQDQLVLDLSVVL